jgi:hypothetical protein
LLENLVEWHKRNGPRDKNRALLRLRKNYREGSSCRAYSGDGLR